jgi:hypothetical protein
MAILNCCCRDRGCGIDSALAKPTATSGTPVYIGSSEYRKSRALVHCAMRSSRHRRLAWLILLLLPACDGSRDAVARVRDMTVPAGSSASQLSGPVVEGLSVEYSWDVERNVSWNRYVDSIAARIVPPFNLIRRAPDAMSIG